MLHFKKKNIIGKSDENQLVKGVVNDIDVVCIRKGGAIYKDIAREMQ